MTTLTRNRVLDDRIDVRMKVGATWVGPELREIATVIDPSTGGPLAEVPPVERARVLRGVSDLVRSDGDRLARLISNEQLNGFHTGHRPSGMIGDDGIHGLDKYRRTVSTSRRAETAADLMPADS